MGKILRVFFNFRLFRRNFFLAQLSTMSGGPGTDALQLNEEDVVKFLLSGTHLGSNNIDHQMQEYVYKRKPDGMYVRTEIL